MRVPGSNPGGTIFNLPNYPHTLYSMYHRLYTIPYTIYNIPYTLYTISLYTCMLLRLLPLYFPYSFFPYYFTYIFFLLTFPYLQNKKAAEGSFDQPTCKLWACRATTAPPRFLLLITLPSFSKNSIAGNRTRGTNVRGLHVTNYTTMDSYIYYILLY